MRHKLEDLIVAPHATLRAAMSAIDSGACEIALVVDDGKLVGTLTDGDVRRALLAGAGLESPTFKCMQREFTAVSPLTGRAEVLDLMRARFFQQIPVIDDAGRLLGLHLLQELIGAAMRPNWAVIMAGGKGTRLLPITESIPKPMVQVAGRPILERIILHLVGFGIRRIYLSVNYMAEAIIEHFGDGGPFGCEIRYLKEDIPLGTGGSLSLLDETPEEPLLVLNGDLLTEVDIGRLLRFHEEGRHAATIAVRQHDYTVPYGVVRTSNGRLEQLVEKPVESWLVNSGIYVLSPHFLSRFPRGEKVDMPQMLEGCLERNEPVGVFEIADSWMDIGRPGELRRARGEE